MRLCPFLALAALLTFGGCAPRQVVVVDDEVPLAAPLEPDWALAETMPGPTQEDPPSRVVRVNYTAGSVSRQPAGMDGWVPAATNHPLAAGDRLWVAPDSRAELHAGATDLRLDQGTGLDVLRLDDRTLQLGLPQGTLELRVFQGREGDAVEVDTPVGAVFLDQPGIYRVEADPDGSAGRITVRTGQAGVAAAGTTVPVGAGTTMDVSGGVAPRYDLMAAGQPDAFDQWCAARERREDGSESTLYVGRALIGYEDLDGQGRWQMDATYGTIWVPRVPAGWAPFRDGHWAWVEPWGWTWVDRAPWGFAPSHYGRWAYLDHAWSWLPHAPGMRSATPVYAPATVGFVSGPGIRGPVRAAGVAWFPLGPREPYLPAYPASRAYVRGLNAPDLAPAAAAGAGPAKPAGYANPMVPGALTVVPQGVFTGALPVAAAALTVRLGSGTGLHVGGAPALAPRPESVLASAVPASQPAGPASAAFARPLVVRSRLPLAPVSFQARQQALAAAQGRPLSALALGQLRQREPAAAALPARLATAVPGDRLRPLHPGAPTRPSALLPSAYPGAGRTYPPATRPGPGPVLDPLAAEKPGQGRPGRRTLGGRQPRNGNGGRPNLGRRSPRPPASARGEAGGTRTP
jgi:hypothetical protein